MSKMTLFSDNEDSENDTAFVDLSADDDINSSYSIYSSEYDSDEDDHISNEDKKAWNLITLITPDSPYYAKRTDNKAKQLRRSMYKDISIKVESDIYELDRIELALKSDYFEKLFTTDFDPKENDYLEIHTIDTDTFSTIVDIIYGRELIEVLNVDNFAALILAMDYLQMEIDLKVFHDFISKNFLIRLWYFSDLYKLIKSIDGNPNFVYLLPTLYQYLSIHFIDALEFKDFLSLDFNQLVKIINRNQIPRHSDEKRKIGRICTEWICIDIENRLPHMIDLVNAAKYRYYCDFRVDGRSMNTKFLLEIDDQKKQKKEMERYFNNLMNQNGQIDAGKQETPENNAQVFSVINKIDLVSRWTSFLENEFIYDITIKVDQKDYKLHRCKLKSKSAYFNEKDLDVATDDKETPLKPLNKDEVHHLDGIHQLTFETIIEYIYFDSIDFDTNVNIVNLLKASEILKLEDLMKECRTYIIGNISSTRIYEQFVEILNYSIGKEAHKILCVSLRDHIVSTWPRIGSMPEFGSISYTIFKSMLYLEKLEINYVDEILDICSKWIVHDAPNRYKFLPRIANTITRNSLISHGNFDLETPADWNDCSQQFIRDKLWQLLSSIHSVISGNDGSNSKNEQQESAQRPMFIGTSTQSNNLFVILDLDFNKIAEVYSLKVGCNEEPSAALIGDNLFLLFYINKKANFQVYNLSSKKLFSLGISHRIMTSNHLKRYTLLNCNNEPYCCYEDGAVLKYSIEVNRWIEFSKRMPDRGIVNFTSNGKTLFRLSKAIQTKRYIAEYYDFVENSWIELPKFSSRLHKWCFSKANPVSITTINEVLAILLDSDIVVFDHQSHTWRDFEIALPNSVNPNDGFGSSIFTQHEGKLLCMMQRQIWNISLSNGECTSNQKAVPNNYLDIVAVN